MRESGTTALSAAAAATVAMGPAAEALRTPMAAALMVRHRNRRPWAVAAAARTRDSLPIGGAGGGAIGLTVTGTLQVDGRISASGLAGSGRSTGGGSGGSIYLRVGTLTGSGVISANGGAGNSWGGGGGGGRIAVVYGANRFSGLMSAYGGGGYGRAARARSTLRPPHQRWEVTPSSSWTMEGRRERTQAGPASGRSDLTVRGGAVVASSASQTVGELVLASNGLARSLIS